MMKSKKDIHVKWAIRDVPEDAKMWAFLIVAGSSGEVNGVGAVSEEKECAVISRDRPVAAPFSFEYPTVIKGQLGKIEGSQKNLPVEIWTRADLAKRWNNAFHRDSPDLEILRKLRAEIQKEDFHKRLLDLPDFEKESVPERIFGFGH